MTMVRPEDIDTGFVPRPVAGVDAVDIGGEAVLVHEDGTRLRQLNATAALVWACLDGTGTVGDIAADLADGLDLPVGVVAEDVLALVRDLGEKRLLEGVEIDDRPAAWEPDADLDPRFVGEPPSY